MNEILAEALRYAKNMWRYRWLALAAAWVLTIGGWLFVLTLPDKFASEARVYVDTGSLLAPLLKGIAIANDPAQEILIMQRTLLSRPNLEQVMRMNDLDLTATNPRQVDKLLERLADNIAITAQTKNLFNITYSDANPRLAQAIVQSVLTIFVENNLGQSRKDMETARGFIEKQIADYERQLQQAERRRAEFMAKNGQYLSKGSFADKLIEGKAHLQATRLKLQDAEIRRDELLRQLATIPLTISSAAAAPGGNSLAARLATAENNLDNLKLQYTDKHPDVVATQKLIEKLKDQLEKEGPASPGTGVSNPLYENVKIKVVEAETEIASLRRSVDEAVKADEENRALMDKAPRIEAELTDLDRDYSVLKSNYEQLLARREAARISQAQEATNSQVQFRVIDPPRLPIIPSSPNRPMLYVLSLAFGVGAGGGLAFLLASLNSSFSSINDLSNRMNLPVLGRVSLIRTALDEMQRRKENWRFGLASGSLVASLGVVWLIGPQLVGVMGKFGADALSFMFGGPV